MFFSRKRSRVAAQASDSASEGAPNSPCRSPASASSSSSPNKATSFPLRRKLHLHFLRLRISALLRLLNRLRLSCRHALLDFTTSRKKRTAPPKAPRVGLAFSGQCSRRACAPDAIADCIEFIKRSASSSSSSSSYNYLSLSSPPSSPPRQQASRLRHDTSPPSSPRQHSSLMS